jgi:hypothetical protein
MTLNKRQTEASSLAGWLVLLLLIALILVKGVLTFTAVGDRGQPTWDFGIVQDLPGLSPYAIYRKLPYPQHVRGQEGE